MNIMKLTAALLPCCMIALSCNETSYDGIGPDSYSWIQVTPTTATVSDSYPASIRGRQDIAVIPQVSGTISKVCVKEGQKVKAGQSLFIIDQVPFLAAVQMADANVEAARAGVETAQLVYESRKTLYEESVVSEFDLKTAFNSLATAKAQLAQAKAQKVTADNNLRYTRVESQADGVVGTINYREGTLVSPAMSKPLTTVSDNSLMYVYFSVSENKFIDMIGEHGTMEEVINSLPEAYLRQSNGSMYKNPGKVETVSGVIDSNTGSVSFRAVFPNDGGLLHSGAAGSVVLKRQISNCYVIPCSAIFEVQDLTMAYKWVDGSITSVILQGCKSDDAKSFIAFSGVDEGDIIISEGVNMLREGQEISIEER